MRELILDTETTGLSPREGHRVVEIGCVELINRMPTGRNYHAYINPERDMPHEAFNVHGLSAEFLQDKPVFAQIADEFLAFIGGDSLVIHNASFDMMFLNFELALLRHPPIGNDRVVDTLLLARRKHPGGSNSLDALCSRYGIDNSRRTKHGALLDAEILSEVYAELLGGRQADLGLAHAATARATIEARNAVPAQRPQPLPPRVSEAERLAHARMVESLGEKALWSGYIRS